MKHMLVLAVVAIVLFALPLNAQTLPAKQVSDRSSGQPYNVENKNVTMGNQAYAQKVLWAWRYFQDNQVDKMAELFADDVVAAFPDGSTVKGRDKMMSVLRQYRDALASVQSDVDACVTLNSDAYPDTQVVSIWGTDTTTDKAGKTSKTHYNEVWFFNKDGKVFQVYQTAARDPEGQ